MEWGQALTKQDRLDQHWTWGEFGDLLTIGGIEKLDQAFDIWLQAQDSSAHVALAKFRSQPTAYPKQAMSDLILVVAPRIAEFLQTLFASPETQVFDQGQRLLKFRQTHVLPAKKPSREALLMFTDQGQAHAWLLDALQGQALSENTVVDLLDQWVNQGQTDQLERFQSWAFERWHDRAYGTDDWFAFWQPASLNDYVTTNASPSETLVSPMAAMHRDDFAHIDSYMSPEQIIQQSGYCKLCHPKSVDYCRSGFLMKRGQADQHIKDHPVFGPLNGCPLDEKISEMHWLQTKGLPLAALVTVMIDNPFCAATGHRICNDCMKSCIYQKQAPVDTPQVESALLNAVLSQPWGFEIVDCLIKWNPLRPTEHKPAKPLGYKAMVVGLGPAGFSMAHHLWMRGVWVMACDGLPLKPWPLGDVSTPIKDWFATLDQQEDLNLGFGGVSHYGITARWDKRLLQVIHLSLLRRQGLMIKGHCRLGGSFTVSDVWRWGFDHLVLAVGAGLPQALTVPGSLSPGMVMANDFLMDCHQSQASTYQPWVSMDVCLPALVIGAGLTATDAATEWQTYYVHHCIKTMLTVDHHIKHKGQASIQARLSPRDWQRLQRWVAHGRQLYACKQQALAQLQDPDFLPLLKSFGGVTMVYRKGLKQAPAYRQNPEELQAALNQGVALMEWSTPWQVHQDAHGDVKSLEVLKPWRGALKGECWQLTSTNKGWVLIPEQDSKMWSYDQDHAIETLVVTTRNGEGYDVWLKVLAAKSNQTIEVDFWGRNDQGSVDEGGKLLKHKPDQGPWSVVVKQGYKHHQLPCQSLLVATGSKPNTAYAYEHKGELSRDADGFYQRFYEPSEEQGHHDQVASMDESDDAQAFFACQAPRGQTVSVIGDCHKHYHGSVVKAMASAQQAAPHVVKALLNLRFGVQGAVSPEPWMSHLSEQLQSTLVDKRWLSNSYCQLMVRSPWLSKQARPGHWFRLSVRPKLSGAIADWSESLALTYLDAAQGLLGFVIPVDTPMQIRQCQSLSSEDVIGLMGPTGVRLSLSQSYRGVIILADESSLWTAAFYAKALTSVGTAVTFFVPDSIDSRLLSTIDLDAVTAVVHLPKLVGNGNSDVIDELAQSWELAEKTMQVNIDAVFIQGQARFLKSWYAGLREVYQQLGRQGDIKWQGSVKGPMQCMLKGLCARCFQWQIDPSTGQRTKAVFACSWQDQPLPLVDLDHLESRQTQPAVVSIEKAITIKTLDS